MTFRVRKSDNAQFRKLEIHDNASLVAIVVTYLYTEKTEFIGNTLIDYNREDIQDIYTAINAEIGRYRYLTTGQPEDEWIGNQWRQVLGWKLAFKSFQTQLDKFQVSVETRAGSPVVSNSYPMIELDATDAAIDRISSPAITHFRVVIET